MKTTLPIALILTLSALQFGCRTPERQTIGVPSTGMTSASGAQAPPTISSGATDAIPAALLKLNQLFLDGYKARQASLRTNISPLIVANFSTLELYSHGLAETNRCIPDTYHALKAVAHVPFGIFLRVEAFADAEDARIPAPVLQALDIYKTQVEAAVSSLPAAGFSEIQIVRQRRILGASLAYLKNVMATKTAARNQLMSFAQEVGPMQLENANDTAAAQLEMTHAVVMKWKQQIPAEEWKRLVVVVRGPQMPRRMNILTQYFAKLLREPSHNLGYPLESRRLIYAEFIPKDRDALDLMATTFIDGAASEAFFGDRWRMSSDVLADGAEQYLKTVSFEGGS